VAAELKEAFQVTSTLIPGGGGIFKITVDGRVVYSKAETGRFPNPGESSRLVGA
jgi:selT/selW/selH-like putative selenoprotein